MKPRMMSRLSVVTVALALAGCVSVNSPPTSPAVSGRAVSDHSPQQPGLNGGRRGTKPPASPPQGSTTFQPLHTDGAPPPGSTGTWYLIASAWVDRNLDKTVGGGRYELHFLQGSLAQGAQITIKEWDSHVLDVEFGPHGIQFGTPVKLRVDYSGTNADPNIAMYDGSRPAFFGFNEQTGTWEEIPGYDDRSQLKYFVELRHFSRYALGSKASW